MHGIHTHIPETNHVPRGYIVSAILSLFVVPLCLVPALVLLFFIIIIIIIIIIIAFLLLLLSLVTGLVSPIPLPELTVIPTAQASSFRLHYLPYYL